MNGGIYKKVLRIRIFLKYLSIYFSGHITSYKEILKIQNKRRDNILYNCNFNQLNTHQKFSKMFAVAVNNNPSHS